MHLKMCKIMRCDRYATWTVTVDGHPNVAGCPTWAYCADHVTASVPVHEDAPAPYVVTVRGPFPAVREYTA